MTIPALVSGDSGVASLIVLAADNNGALEAEANPESAAFASPKSINFAPFLVIMMFPGFKSR
jgi:hypothetical protein